MPGSKYTYGAIMPVLTLLIFSCDDTTSSSQFPFEVTVTGTNGLPIEGVIVEGGFDWYYFRIFTDRWGRAEIPGFAHDFPTTFHKDNYFSMIVDHLRPDVYTLTPAPRVLREIGGIKGDLIRFDDSRVLTVTYQGQYRVYSYNEYDVSEMLMVELPLPVVQFKLFGDSLWYTTYDDGIYVYSLADPMNPTVLIHLDIDGYLRAFDIKDSLVAVGVNSGPGPIRLFSYHTDGTVNLLDTMGALNVWRIYFRSHYLIATRHFTDEYSVFDVADPNDVRFEYQGGREGYYSPIFHGDTLILEGSGIDSPAGKYSFLMIDMSDPGNPSDIGEFMAEGHIHYIVDDFTAVGKYYYDSDALSVFKRRSGADFEAVAMVSEYGYNFHQGSHLPYFLIAGKFWKLEN